MINQKMLARGRKAAMTRERNQTAARKQDTEERAEKVLKRLQRGEPLRHVRPGWYAFKDGIEIRGDAVQLLIRHHQAKNKGKGFVVLSSPEEYDAERRDREQQGEANKRKRLDRWTKMIAEQLDIKADPGTLDEVLESIYTESSRITALEADD